MKKIILKKSCYESKKVCKLLESLQTKPRDLDSFFIKNTEVKIDSFCFKQIIEEYMDYIFYN